MGWRGVLRSVAAASRAADRERQRGDRALQRGHDQIDRVVGKLDAEVERDLQKLQRFEEKLRAQPLSASGLRYESDGQWVAKQLRDDTGMITWKMDLGIKSDGFSGGGAVADANRTYELVALAATRWGVLTAFRVSVAAVGVPQRPTKLFKRADPGTNRLVLVCNGVLYRALEGQLDRDVPAGASEFALVAFPLPKDASADLSIQFLFKGGGQTLGVRLNDARLFEQAMAEPSVLDQMRSKLAEHTTPLFSKAASVKAELRSRANSGASSGWFWLLVLIGLLAVIGALSG